MSQQANSIHDISTHYEAILRLATTEAPIIPLYRRYDLELLSCNVSLKAAAIWCRANKSKESDHKLDKTGTKIPFTAS
jgi:hypothetical protein